MAASLRLFNERGTDVVTVRHIAQAVGISHGNLCYHFPNTDALVVGLYEQLVARLSESLAGVADAGFDLPMLRQLANQTMATLYEYRFLMLDFAAIMRRLPTIREAHRGLMEQRAVLFRHVLTQLRVNGLLKPELYEGHDEHLLTQLFIIGDFWIASAEWLYESSLPDKLSYYQQVLTALLVPLLTEQGRVAW